MRCILDGSQYDPPLPVVDLTALCIAQGWIWATIADALIAQGYPDDPPDYDVSSFVYHIFAKRANGPSYDPTRKLNFRQHNILTCA